MTNALGTKLQQEIDERGLSTRKAAAHCGIKHSTFINVLYGRTKRPDEDVLMAIAEGFDLSYSGLALAAYGVITDSPAIKEAAAVG
jgi:transcriptional regulator with XRE-family HTH domain